jgi:lysophospholipase L1-like esterase
VRELSKRIHGKYRKQYKKFVRFLPNSKVVMGALVLLALAIIFNGFLLYRYETLVKPKSDLANKPTAKRDSTVSAFQPKEEKPRTTAVFLGDSFTEGTGTSSPERGYLAYAAKAAGLDARPAAEGGTGIIADRHQNNSKNQKFRDRLAKDVFPYHPDVVVIAGGANDAGPIDDGTVTLDEYRAEYDALIGYIQKGLPDTKIIVLGPF